MTAPLTTPDQMEFDLRPAPVQERPARRWFGFPETVDGSTLRLVLGDPTTATWERMKGESA